MAAVLCSTFGDLLKGCCDGIGKVITLPCRACGCACNTFGELLTSPFFPYLALTFGLNMPALVYGLKSLGFDCPELCGWLLGNAILSAIHMVAAMYIVNKIRETPASLSDPINKTADSEAPATNYGNFSIPKQTEQGAANSFSRIKHVLCYDKAMAVYIVIFIGWIVWLSTGIAKRLTADESGGCDNEIQAMNVVISCGYMYLSFVFLAFGCSLCCLR
jgi:hypothetical protein